MTVKLLAETSSLREVFKVLKPAISKEATRYSLNGVLFEKIGKEVFFVATDGHKMINIDVLNNQYLYGTHFEGDEDFSFIMPREAIEEFIAPDKLKSQFTEISIAGERVTFTFDVNVASKTYKLLDGTFPEWRKVVPKDTKKLVGFNPKYIEQICKALKGNDHVFFECKTETVDVNGEVKELDPATQPQVLTTTKGAKIVIMPVRV